MTRRRALAIVLVALAVVIAAAATALAKKPGGGKPPPGQPQPATFEISGSIDGLVPSVGGELALKLENPAAFPIAVQTLEVTVGDAGAGCEAHHLLVGGIGLPVAVPAAGEATVMLAVELAGEAPHECEGARFPLAYTGTATRS